jgi:hypothetical protein
VLQVARGELVEVVVKCPLPGDRDRERRTRVGPPNRGDDIVDAVAGGG